MARTRRTAYSILNDPVRPFAFLAQRIPTPPDPFVRPSEYDFLDDLASFHAGSRISRGRFQSEYEDACQKLTSVLADLEFQMPRVCLFPDKSPDPEEWRLHVMNRRWDLPHAHWPAYSTHHLWFELHSLYLFLRLQPEPVFQRKHLLELGSDLLWMITQFLPMPDVRRLAATCRGLYGLGHTLLGKYGKVSLWYTHARLSSSELHRVCDKLEAPYTQIGFGLASLWKWLECRELSGRAPHLLSLVLVNRWSWSRTVYAEASWTHRRDCATGWSNVFYCALLSFPALRNLRVDGFALPHDGMTTLALHKNLSSLHLHACGFFLADEDRYTPTLPRVQNLTLGWDPASPYEIAAAERVMEATPNLIDLRLYHRSLPNSKPLCLSADWTGTRLRFLASLSVTGSDPQFVLALAGNRRMPRLQSVKLHFHTTPQLDAVQAVLNCLAITATQAQRLEVLVLHGIPRPSIDFLAGIARTFPRLVDLALLPRLINQTRVTSHDWVTPGYFVAAALSFLFELRRFCCNFPFADNATSPKRLDTLITGDSSLTPSHAREVDDGLCEWAAAAIPFFAVFPALASFTATDGTAAHTAHSDRPRTQHGSSDPSEDDGPELCTIATGSAWWELPQDTERLFD